MLRQILFGDPSYGSLKRGLDAGAARLRVVAENIANAETPGYRAREVAFDDLLGAAQHELKLTCTQPGHRSGADGTHRPADPEVVPVASPTPDGAASNVDLERELVALQKNEIRFQALSQTLANKYRAVRDAIRPSA